jgi:hypothetical protein
LFSFLLCEWGSGHGSLSNIGSSRKKKKKGKDAIVKVGHEKLQ